VRDDDVRGQWEDNARIQWERGRWERTVREDGGREDGGREDDAMATMRETG
jgi:hypothetical protein